MVLEKGRANTNKREERRKEEEEEEDYRYGTTKFEYGYMSWVVWKSSFGLESLETWFRTLYLGYGLGLGTPKFISCRVELRSALRLLDMCFEKGLVAS